MDRQADSSLTLKTFVLRGYHEKIMLWEKNQKNCNHTFVGNLVHWYSKHRLFLSCLQGSLLIATNK